MDGSDSKILGSLLSSELGHGWGSNLKNVVGRQSTEMSLSRKEDLGLEKLSLVLLTII